MQHAEVENSHAVERYLLNEMSEDERDRFEEHYFDCRVCAAEVVMGTRLFDNGRVIAREMDTVVPIASRRSRMAIWLPLASAAILTVLVATLLVPRQTDPSLDLIQPHLIAAGESRAGGDATPTLRAGEPAVLFVDVPPDPPFPRYEIQIRDSSRNVRVRRPVSAEQASETVYLLLRSLPAGNYVLAIEGVREDGNRTEITTRQLRVQ